MGHKSGYCVKRQLWMGDKIMQAQAFTLERYLKRVGLDAAPPVTVDGLTQLMRAQLKTVTFENLDVQAGKGVSLDPEAIATKILNHRRGGYCYEVNGLFSMALTALGIGYRFVAARPMFYPMRRPRTHMALVATVEGRDFLSDLGFGNYGLRAPIALDSLGGEVVQDGDRFRLTRGDDGFLTLAAWANGTWVNQYAFDLSPQEWIDFAPANYLNSTHPDTIFVQKLVAIRQHAGGRYTLFGSELTVLDRGETTRREIAPGERAGVLRDLFDLDVPAALC
ncbi:arylamine N-acetyltransferase family protein [Oryzibacter oryziterrae]|uniref:arylamine N-acetyltransferase family protein n=1 Tax=Oryzibacter oryziterrae TaxID=2766474 RepID=UPI001F43FEAC|nr:arylamine N-acetyltransferase [Oryzibacter oryziterrae]